MKFFISAKKKPLQTVFFVIFALFLIFLINSVWETATMYVFTSSPSYHLTKMNSLVPENIPPFAEFAVLHPVRLSAFVTFFYATCCISFFGMWRGKKWGFKSAAYLFYLSALVLIVFLLKPSLFIPQPIYNNGYDLYPEFNSMVKKLVPAFRFICGIGTLACIWGAMQFDRMSVKNIFDDNAVPETKEKK